jgi:glycerol-3-phosphate dehydrogenase (NAD(P)+)
MNISIIGTGVYGLALANVARKNGNTIKMWTENPDVAKEYKDTGMLKSIYDIELKRISVSNDLEYVMEDADLIIIVTASKYVDITARNMKEYYKGTPICIASKGLEDTTGELLSEVVKKILNTRNIAVLSGPTFAKDLLTGQIGSLALASYCRKTKKIVMNALMGSQIKIRESSDIIGLQICGCVKNVYAIGSGILDGLGYSNSTQAFLITEAIHDMKDIIYYMGGSKKTVLSYAGIGDLILTCTSIKSRNYSFGKLLAEDKKKAQKYLMDTTVEGYHALNVVYQLLQRKRVHLPLIEMLYDIVYNEVDPEKLIELLLSSK